MLFFCREGSFSEVPALGSWSPLILFYVTPLLRATADLSCGYGGPYWTKIKLLIMLLIILLTETSIMANPQVTDAYPNLDFAFQKPVFTLVWSLGLVVLLVARVKSVLTLPLKIPKACL